MYIYLYCVAFVLNEECCRAHTWKSGPKKQLVWLISLVFSMCLSSYTNIMRLLYCSYQAVITVSGLALSWQYGCDSDGFLVSKMANVAWGLHLVILLLPQGVSVILWSGFVLMMQIHIYEVVSRMAMYTMGCSDGIENWGVVNKWHNFIYNSFLSLMASGHTDFWQAIIIPFRNIYIH